MNQSERSKWFLKELLLEIKYCYRVTDMVQPQDHQRMLKKKHIAFGQSHSSSNWITAQNRHVEAPESQWEDNVDGSELALVSNGIVLNGFINWKEVFKTSTAVTLTTCVKPTHESKLKVHERTNLMILKKWYISTSQIYATGSAYILHSCGGLCKLQ